MNKKNLVLTAVLMALCMMAFSCATDSNGEDSSNSGSYSVNGTPAGMVGKWVSESTPGDDSYMEIKSDDTIWWGGSNGEYKYCDIIKCTFDEITTSFEYKGTTSTSTWKYELSYDKLVFKYSSGSEDTYKRKN